MARYRSKPTEVEAVQWRGDNAHEEVFPALPRKVCLYNGEQLDLLAGKDGAQGWVPVPLGHWLVWQPGDLSDVWPVEDDYFTAKYEPVE